MKPSTDSKIKKLEKSVSSKFLTLSTSKPGTSNAASIVNSKFMAF